MFVWQTKDSEADWYPIWSESRFKHVYWLDFMGTMTAGQEWTVMLLFCKMISSEERTRFKVIAGLRPWNWRRVWSPSSSRLNTIEFWISAFLKLQQCSTFDRTATIKLVIPTKTDVRLYLTHRESEFLANVSITETFEKIRITTQGDPSLETGWNS